jgi:glycosyltransferase involved in cell wall biosynthesis
VKALNLIRKSTGLNICLKLIGGGSRSYALKLKETILHEQLERYVTMIGNIKHGDLIKEYQSADIFVFASSCETFGITLLEAMGSRLPIACSNRTGLYDILKDAGLYFNPEDVRNISEIIEELILNIELRQKLGELAYAFAKHYTWERCALETFQYLKTVRNVL